jgi:hypothetical protein
MSADEYNPDYEYVAYIDESGETGLKNVLGADQAGSSERFVLSLLLVPKSKEPNIGSWVAQMIRDTGSHQLSDLHFAKLPEARSDEDAGGKTGHGGCSNQMECEACGARLACLDTR